MYILYLKKVDFLIKRFLSHRRLQFRWGNWIQNTEALPVITHKPEGHSALVYTLHPQGL